MDYHELLATYGSPLYVYNSKVLKERCKEMKQFKMDLQERLTEKSRRKIHIQMHYSTKANNNPAILKYVMQAGLGVDCMSELELITNVRCGFSPSDMLYVCNNIDEEEMLRVVLQHKVLICLDSISQVETLGKVLPGLVIMVRINPGVKGVGHSKEVITSGSETKFGISEDNLPELLHVANKYRLRIVGTHQHLGSLFLNDKIPQYIAGVKAGLKIVEKYFPQVDIVDLGGGFGIPYKPGEEKLDLKLLQDQLLPVLVEFVDKHPAVREFKFEPGRFIPAEAGILVAKVTAVKHGENGKIWVGTDAGMNQLVRPSMYGSYHHIDTIVSEFRGTADVNFCGNVCESGDVLGRDRKVLMPEVGDIVLIENAGAYGYSMASNYTGRLRPAEVMIGEKGKPRLIRKRETVNQLLENVIF